MEPSRRFVRTHRELRPRQIPKTALMRAGTMGLPKVCKAGRRFQNSRLALTDCRRRLNGVAPHLQIPKTALMRAGTMGLPKVCKAGRRFQNSRLALTDCRRRLNGVAPHLHRCPHRCARRAVVSVGARMRLNDLPGPPVFFFSFLLLLVFNHCPPPPSADGAGIFAGAWGNVCGRASVYRCLLGHPSVRLDGERLVA